MSNPIPEVEFSAESVKYRKEQISARIKIIQKSISDKLAERGELLSLLAGALGTEFDELDKEQSSYVREVVECNKVLKQLTDERRELRHERDSLSYCGNPECCTHGAYAPYDGEDE